MIVGGLDLSLRSTGMAKANTTTGQLIATAVRPRVTGHDRLEYLLGAVVPWLAGEGHRCDVVVVEGVLMGKVMGNSILDLAGLGTLVRHELWRHGVPYALINPSTLKLYATGNGHADKAAMVAAAYRLLPQVTTRTNDEADAVWLAEAGCRHYGHPLCQLPPKQAAVLSALAAKGKRKGQPVIIWPALGVRQPVQGALPGLAARP